MQSVRAFSQLFLLQLFRILTKLSYRLPRLILLHFSMKFNRKFMVHILRHMWKRWKAWTMYVYAKIFVENQAAVESCIDFSIFHQKIDFFGRLSKLCDPKPIKKTTVFSCEGSYCIIRSLNSFGLKICAKTHLFDY